MYYLEAIRNAVPLGMEVILLLLKYNENFVILQSIGIIVIKSKNKED